MIGTLLPEGGEAIEIEPRGNRAVANPYDDAILRDLVALEQKWGLIQSLNSLMKDSCVERRPNTHSTRLDIATLAFKKED